MITTIDKQTALILIDLQKGLVKMEAAGSVKKILLKASMLVDVFRTARLPIVIVHVDPLGAAWTKTRVEVASVPQNPFMQTIAKVTMPIMGFTDIVPEIVIQPEDILIEKKSWNAFFQTSLDKELKKRKITQIVLAGISTSRGVEGTARAASELGYNLIFATDAMTDKVKDAHDNSIRNIFPRIGELGTVMEITRKLSSVNKK
ncbi:MAG: isochorismatase family protein [Bacteroidota bacterium]|nr:isochorismatase family protein [Bacteroidota bacterium]